MANAPTRVAGAVLLVLVALAGVGLACGDDDRSDIAPTPDPRTERAADRPDWFPATFPLPAETTVISATPAATGAGGSVQFSAPVPLSRTILILDNNLETSSHGYKILNREANESGATYGIENDEFTGTVKLTPGDNLTLIDVELKARS